MNMYHLFSLNDDLEMQLKAPQWLQSGPCGDIGFVSEVQVSVSLEQSDSF